MGLQYGSYTQIASALNTLTPRSIDQLGVDVEMAYCVFNNATLYYGVALKLSGASVTVGAEDSIDQAGNSSLDSMDVIGQKADGSKAGHYYMDDSDFKNEANIHDVNTTSLALTLGSSPLTVPSDSGSEDRHAMGRISDTLALIIHQKWVSGGGRLNAYKLTEASSAYTAGSALTIDSDVDNDEMLALAILSTSRAFAFYWSDVGDMKVALLNISGATPTLTDGPDIFDTGARMDNAHRQKRAIPLSSTKAVVGYHEGTTVKLCVIENVADVITPGTPFTVNTGGNRVNSIAQKSATQFLVSYRSSAVVESFTVSGTTITRDNDSITLPAAPGPASIAESILALVDTTGGTDEWIVVARDANNDLWTARVFELPPVNVACNPITLAGSVEALTDVVRPVYLPEITLASTVETANVIPVRMQEITLASTVEGLNVIPIPTSSITLAGTVESITIGQAFSMAEITLAGSVEGLAVVPGGVTVVMDELTLAGSVEAAVLSPGNRLVLMDEINLLGTAVDLGRVQVLLFTPAEIANLRETAHKSILRLTIFSPPTLWAGQVNGAHDRGATTVTYDNGTGSLDFVRGGLELWVGTAPGLDDIDRNRLDNVGGMALATGSFVIDGNGTVWQDGLYLSIKHNFPIERINPRLVGGVLYKMHTVAYTNQNGQDNTDPVCLAGADQIGELSGGSLVFDMDLSDSHPTTGGVISSYALSIAPTTGASVTAFDAGTGIGTITATAAGYWWAICSCTDSFGNSTERLVLLRAHGGADTEFLQVEIVDYQETWGGGVRMSMEARANVLLSDVPDNATAYLWYDQYHDGVASYVNIFKRDDGRNGNILFNGYIRRDSSRDDLNTGDGPVTFEMTTVDGVMANLPMRAIALRLASSPSDWYEYQLMTTGEAIWFLFRWHTTVHTRHDIIGIRTFDATQYRANADFEEGSIFTMVNRAAYDRGVKAKITCDRFGRIHFVQDSQLLGQSERDALKNILDITEDDVSGVINTVRDPEERVFTMQLSGFSYSSSGTGTPWISIIPGYRPSTISYSVAGRRGSSFRNVTEQLVESQNDANVRVGRHYATDNRPIREFRIKLRGNYLGALTTICSYGFYEMNIANTSLARELNVNRIRMTCRGISGAYNDEGGYFQVTATFEPEAQGPDGIPGNYPTSQPVPLIPAPPLEIEEPAEAALITQNPTNIRLTAPDTAEDLVWTQLSAAGKLHGIIDPWWQIVNQTVDPANIVWLDAQAGQIRLVDQATDPVTITDITPTTDPPNTWSDGVAPTAATVSYVELLADKWIQDRFYAVAEWTEVGGDWRSWIAYTSDAGLTWTWKDFFDGYTLPQAARCRNIAVNGTYLLVSLWESPNTGDTPFAQGSEYLRAWTKSDFIGVRRQLFNTVSFEEAAISVSSSQVATVIDDDTLWFVFGNMIGTEAFPTMTSAMHVMFSLDSGINWRSYPGIEWKQDKCIAWRADIAEVSGQRPVWAIKA